MPAGRTGIDLCLSSRFGWNCDRAVAQKNLESDPGHHVHGSRGAGHTHRADTNRCGKAFLALLRPVRLMLLSHSTPHSSESWRIRSFLVDLAVLRAFVPGAYEHCN